MNAVTELVAGLMVSLDRLHKLQLERGELQAKETAELDALLVNFAPEIDAIKADYAGDFGAIDAEIATLQKNVKDGTIGFGSTVKGKSLMAVYSKPRVTWDGKGLSGYAVAHPEIEAFKKTGKPSVSIRKMK